MSTHTAPSAPAEAGRAPDRAERRQRRPTKQKIAREAGVYLGTLGLAAAVEGVTGRWQQVVAVLLLGGVALAMRRRWPLLAAAIPVVAIGWSTGAQVLLIVLCYGAGYRVTRRAHLYAWLAGFIAAGIATCLAAWRLGAHGLWAVVLQQVLVLAVAVVVPGLVGQYRAQRHALHAAWRDRADRAERERAIAAEQARLRERTRIAQDMHDALGHQLALLSLQAASLEVDTTLSAQQRETSRLLGATARTAMDELRAVVGALHPRDGVAQPLPRRGIDELIESARGAGLRVSLVREGQEQPLSTMTQHALYRVVQEGLTNAHKHAPGSPVTITLRHEPGTLVAEVRNPRSATPAPGTPGGQGIVGLRERVRLIGGLLRAGADGAEYRIVAILPYQARSTEPDQVGGVDGQAPAATSLPAGAALADDRADDRAARHPGAAGIVAAGIVLLFAGSVLVATAANSRYLSRTAYDTIEVGQPERSVVRQLPRRFPASRPRATDPSTGATTSCRVFAVLPADAGPGRGLDTGYRLCFRGGILVDKRELLR